MIRPQYHEEMDMLIGAIEGVTVEFQKLNETLERTEKVLKEATEKITIERIKEIATIIENVLASFLPEESP